MTGTWWSDIVLGFFLGIGLGAGMALINGLINLVAGNVRKT